MANCEKCGARIEEGDEFCPDCGAKILKGVTKKEMKQGAAERPKKHTFWKVVIIFLIIAILLKACSSM